MGILPQLKQDKANHFVYGCIIFMIFGFAFGALVGLLSSIIIGAAKELYDWRSKKGNPETADFFMTSLGGVVCYICAIVI